MDVPTDLGGTPPALRSSLLAQRAAFATLSCNDFVRLRVLWYIFHPSQPHFDLEKMTTVAKEKKKKGPLDSFSARSGSTKIKSNV